jgi:zinc transport system substrate-binding protein
MFAKVIGVVFVIAIGGVVLWYSSHDQVEDQVTDQPGQPLRVVATFYPLQNLAQAVVGDTGEVRAIVPAGIEPHDFEPSPKDIQDLYRADLVIINGAGMDPWAEKLVPELSARGVATLVVAHSVNLLEGAGHGHDHAHADANEHEASHEHEHEGDDHPSHGSDLMLVAEGDMAGADPHFWLDPLVAHQLTDDIARVLGERSPQRAAVLRSKAEAVQARLAALDRQYATGLKTCRLQEVVTSHDAFRYLARRYGFETHALAGLSPEAEPSAKRLTEIAAEARREGIKYIFFETLVSPKLSETLAREVGAETLVFNPIEGVTAEEAAAGVDYFSLMEANLAALRKALECK